MRSGVPYFYQIRLKEILSGRSRRPPWPASSARFYLPEVSFAAGPGAEARGRGRLHGAGRTPRRPGRGRAFACGRLSEARPPAAAGRRGNPAGAGGEATRGGAGSREAAQAGRGGQSQRQRPRAPAHADFGHFRCTRAGAPLVVVEAVPPEKSEKAPAEPQVPTVPERRQGFFGSVFSKAVMIKDKAVEISRVREAIGFVRDIPGRLMPGSDKPSDAPAPPPARFTEASS